MGVVCLVFGVFLLFVITMSESVTETCSAMGVLTNGHLAMPSTQCSVGLKNQFEHVEQLWKKQRMFEPESELPLATFFLLFGPTMQWLLKTCTVHIKCTDTLAI